MKKINFRALIFIDLLASAMGGSIILMLVIASKKPDRALPAGRPRDFILFKVVVPSENIQIKLFVNKKGTKTWYQSNFYAEEKPNTSAVFSQTELSQTEVKMWGPSFLSRKLDSVAYTVYVTSPDSIDWVFSTLYFRNDLLERSTGKQKFDIINQEIAITQYYRTRQKPDTAIILKTTIGNVANPPVIVTAQ